MSPIQTPVALIAFNRPEQTARVLARIREAQPSTLLIISDGPRPDRVARASRPCGSGGMDVSPMGSDNTADSPVTEAALVAETRRLIDESIDWPCRVHKNYSDTNLGCMHRIQSGLDWVFNEVEEAIILEDDCLPTPEFFTLCDTLLPYYRNNPRVCAISGTNLIAQHYRTQHTYWYSNHHWIWGWATWRRAWRDYDPTYATWDARQASFRASYANAWERQYWTSTLDTARHTLAKTNSWAFQWSYTNRSLNRVTIIPRTNLIENLGFTADATHTTNNLTHLAIPTAPLGPITHPSSITTTRTADALWTRLYSQEPLTPLANLKSQLRCVLTP